MPGFLAVWGNLLLFPAESRDGSPVASTPAADGSFVCPVTLGNGGKGGTYGNRALRVVLYPEGKVVFQPGGPGAIHSDGALSMKFGWERRRSGLLYVEGRRLDGPSPPMRASDRERPR
jgi:hypothetical protein